MKYANADSDKSNADSDARLDASSTAQNVTTDSRHRVSVPIRLNIVRAQELNDIISVYSMQPADDETFLDAAACTPYGSDEKA